MVSRYPADTGHQPSDTSQRASEPVLCAIDILRSFWGGSLSDEVCKLGKMNGHRRAHVRARWHCAESRHGAAKSAAGGRSRRRARAARRFKARDAFACRAQGIYVTLDAIYAIQEYGEGFHHLEDARRWAYTRSSSCMPGLHGYRYSVQSLSLASSLTLNDMTAGLQAAAGCGRRPPATGHGCCVVNETRSSHPQ